MKSKEDTALLYSEEGKIVIEDMKWAEVSNQCCCGFVLFFFLILSFAFTSKVCHLVSISFGLLG